MHACLKSACAVLAWSILVVLVAAGMKGSVPPAQANIRTASSSTQVTLASTLSVAAAPKTVARPASRYAVRPGDTLSGIAARFAVRGGWPALYAANRPLIGSDPNVIRPGTVLTVRRPAPAPSAPNPGHRLHPVPPPSAPAGSGHRPVPTGTGAPAASGMPQWLKTMLLAAGLVVGAAFLAEPVLLVFRRRRRRASARAAAVPEQAREPVLVPSPRDGREPDPGHPATEEAGIVLADYDRVVVTQSLHDGTVYVLRPPGEDPRMILRAARLVLPEDLYRELAVQLGMPASWPIVLADYDRVVVTQSQPDGAVYVLRPPGADPRVILRAARLVLPEDPYEELADQLGVPAGLPMR
ncbi:MAG TPA: LysM peptidoglycan-binding domain-containing protein [Streptosporangiaceae bacterium]|nr:LysM peptidoglycan-binding domain-containing protein [Streptosporangiaceae bacterium]